MAIKNFIGVGNRSPFPAARAIRAIPASEGCSGLHEQIRHGIFNRRYWHAASSEKAKCPVPLQLPHCPRTWQPLASCTPQTAHLHLPSPLQCQHNSAADTWATPSPLITLAQTFIGGDDLAARRRSNCATSARCSLRRVRIGATASFRWPG